MTTTPTPKRVGALQRALLEHMPASEGDVLDLAERTRTRPGVRMHEVRKQTLRCLESLVRRGFVELVDGVYRRVDP